MAGRLLRRLAIPAPDGVRSLRSVASAIAADLPERWKRYGRPMRRTLLDRAVGLASELGPACKQNLLVNFDLHYADVLASRREPVAGVDPMVVAGDRSTVSRSYSGAGWRISRRKVAWNTNSGS